MAEPPKVLIAALSGRALAAAARRAGWQPYVADLFGDRDTREIARACRVVAGDIEAGFDGDSLIRAADQLVPSNAPPGNAPPTPLVVGAGFEDRPALLARLAQDRHLLGNPPEVLASLKDPRIFFPRLDAQAIPHPAVAFRRPAAPDGWLIKQRGAAGGGHIRAAGDGSPLGPCDYHQRRVTGRAISALFLADGKRALPLGFSEQWRAGDHGDDFRFGGLARPASLPPRMEVLLVEVVRSLAVNFGLVGLNSADFLVRDRDFDLLEVNPRPGASLDAFDGEPGLFGLHCRACAGQLPDRWTEPADATALVVLYAPHDLTVPGGITWPDWAADRPAPGTVVRRGHPICTVLAQGGAVGEAMGEARALVAARAAEMLASLQGARAELTPV
ncbi:MAG: ATP-grasp domain-containing protein [Planctomycetota bacterium]